MKLELAKIAIKQRTPRNTADRARIAPRNASRTEVPLCPYTLEPAALCETHRSSQRHRCSFTLEPCAG